MDNKSIVEKDNIESHLKFQLIQAEKIDEIEDILNQMISNNINIQEYLSTTVYRKLVLCMHEYNEFNRINESYGNG